MNHVQLIERLKAELQHKEESTKAGWMMHAALSAKIIEELLAELSKPNAE